MKNAESLPQMSIDRKTYYLLFWRFLGAHVFSVIRRKPHPLLLWRLKERNMKFVKAEEKQRSVIRFQIIPCLSLSPAP